MEDRYIVISGSETAHCCFEATVVDSSVPGLANICECLNRYDADKIADALNAIDARNKDGGE